MDNSIKDILEAKILGQKNKLFELSLARIKHHAENAKKDGFTILTSWRTTNDKKTNIDNFTELKNDPNAFPRSERYFKLEGFSYLAQSYTEKLIEIALFNEIKQMQAVLLK